MPHSNITNTGRMAFFILTVCLLGLVEFSKAQFNVCSAYDGCTCRTSCEDTHPNSIPRNLIGTCPVGQLCCCTADKAGVQCLGTVDDCVCQQNACSGSRPVQSTATDCPNTSTNSICCCDDVTTTGPCDPNPCIHGTCKVVGTDYECTCDAGYVGRNCQIELNECETEPCENGGTCIDRVNAFECQCVPPWVPPTCTTQTVPTTPGPSGGPTDASVRGPDYCHPSPCHNHATCIMKDGNFFCQCGPGYEGRLCQNRDCRCMNGGVCSKGSSYPICDCPDPWYGDHCEYYREKKKN